MWPIPFRAKVVAPRLLAAVVAGALAVGLAACGGGKESMSTESASTSEAKPPVAKKSQGSQSSAASKSSDQENAKAARSKERKEASDFVPKHHTDSGGGSKQFVVKGGDNSVQEFGDEANASELDEAAAALHGFLDARAEGNLAATCEYLSKSTIDSLEHLSETANREGHSSGPKGCGEILDALQRDPTQEVKDEAKQADVGSLRVKGGQAFIVYRGLNKTIVAMPMKKEGGDWKVASLAGVPLN
jgi:predicted lipid-binding transport protein (Tim44 family)